jgi:Mn-dependent DtxR family transcriptional regulator
LKENKGYARITDVAKELSLTKGSVSTAIKSLMEKGLIEHEEETKFLNLTEEGHHFVHEILTTRTLLFYFFRDFLGVDEKTANQDACLMEYLMAEKTSDKLFEFMKGLTTKTSTPLEIKTALNLSAYPDSKSFKEGQKGDHQL